jgi:hypothetical protein
MDEDAWLHGTDLAAMLDYLEGKVSDRKLRLFACACVRRYWDRFTYPIPRQAVEMAERLAEGEAEAQEVEEMRQTADGSAGNAPMWDQFAYMAAAASLAEVAIDAARNTRDLCRQQAMRDAAYEVIAGENEQSINAAASAAECGHQADLLREVIGNPFRPVQIDPNWLSIASGAAAAVAREIDEAHRFEELPYLADALMDAGCSDVVLLEHLRQPAEHVRGCWALDALLGRA